MKMKQCLGAVSLAALTWCAPAVQAQFTGSNQTNTLNAVTNNWSGAYYVGTNAFNDFLLITNGGRLTNSLGFLGYEAGDSNNAALVTGAGSLWTNSSDLVIGVSGSGNQLTVANSGKVVNATAWLGSNAVSAANSVLVTDAGSIWGSRSNLNVGYQGAGNLLTVANGASVTNLAGLIGNVAGANNNAALVTGAGSVWSNRTDLYVGYSGASNLLTIANAGKLANGNGYLGSNATSSANSVLITDAGSIWTNRTNLYVGYLGAGNKLTITNGGTVYNGIGYVGYASNAVNNSILVTGVGSVWSNRTGNLSIGESGGGNALTIANGGFVNGYNGNGYIGNAASASNNSVLVTGAGSIWTNNFLTLYVGNNAAFNTLTISNGGSVYINNSSYAYIGYTAMASNNAVTVTGPGSLWNISLAFAVGQSGSSNRLTVANGGMVRNSQGIIGTTASAGGNAVLVTGAGSIWTNTTDLSVGNTGGSGGLLTIANGGTVYDGSGMIGMMSAASNNTAVVTDAGSSWRNSSQFYVGENANGNTLVISNGGAVYNSSFGYIGFASSNNTALVTGAGSVWTNSGNLTVGNAGPNNSLTIASGGTVAAPAVTVGAFVTSSSNNTLAVHGGNLIATSFSNGVIDIRQGAVTMDSGTMQAQAVWLTNGLAGTLSLTGGTLMANVLTNNGGGNVAFAGCVLEPLNADGNWSAALALLGGVTLNTLDANGQVRTVNLSGAVSGGGVLNVMGTGSLLLNGAVTGGGSINVFPGARLGGTGSAESVQIQSNATLGVGATLGTFTATNLTFNGGAHFQEGLNATSGVAGVDWDWVNVSGAVTLSGLSSVNPLTVDVVNLGGLDGSNVPLNAISWTILTATGGISGYTPQGFAVTTTGLDGWSNGLWSVVQTNNSLQLLFSPPIPVSVTVLANPTNGGSVTGGGIYLSGTHVQIAAVPSNIWSFMGWNDGSKANPYTITVPRSNVTYTATFLPPVTVTCLASPSAGGNASGGGSYLPGSNITLSATANPGWVFLCWNDDVMTNPRGIVVPGSASTNIAKFGSTSGLGAALECTNLNWTLGGNSAWTVENVTKHGTTSAVQSGAINSNEFCYLQVTTNGPCSLQFWWKVSAAPTNCLQFFINTQLVNQISGNVDWNQYVTFLGTSNQVTLTWVYTKNTGAVAGSDAGWVDQVTWTPCPYAEHVPQVLYQDPSGMLASWVLNSTGAFQFSRILANTGGWALKAAGDVDGDGVSDLLFENAAGDIGGWFMKADGSVRDARFWFNIGAWEIKACGDFEGLGHGQLFFQTAAGDAAYWRVDTNGNFLASVPLGNQGTWKLRGAGDLDGDHKAELFWQNPAGTVAVWYHNPSNVVYGAVLSSTPGWVLSGVTDIDNDGVSDLLWQSATGDVAGWFMNSNSTVRATGVWWNTGDWKLKAAGR